MQTLKGLLLHAGCFSPSWMCVCCCFVNVVKESRRKQEAQGGQNNNRSDTGPIGREGKTRFSQVPWQLILGGATVFARAWVCVRQLRNLVLSQLRISINKFVCWVGEEGKTHSSRRGVICLCCQAGAPPLPPTRHVIPTNVHNLCCMFLIINQPHRSAVHQPPLCHQHSHHSHPHPRRSVLR